MKQIMGRCDHCKLAFHTTKETAAAGCQCALHGCGCRALREKTA